MRAIVALKDNAVVLLVLTTLFWGGNAVAGKFAVGEISPLLLTCGRWSLAAVILLVLARRHIHADREVIRANLPYLFAMGTIGFALFNGSLYVALQYTSAINAGIFQASMPMFIFMLNFMIFRTRPFAVQVVGYLLTLVGVVIVAAQGDIGRLLGLEFNIGDLIMIIAAIAYSSYAVALRRKPAMHWMSFLAVLVTSASIASMPFAVYEATTPNFIWPTTFTGIAVLVFTAIFPSILGQGFFIRGNELIGGNKAGLFVNLVPIHAAWLAVVMLGEAFHLFHAIAMALVIFGIVLAHQLAPASR